MSRIFMRTACVLAGLVLATPAVLAAASSDKDMQTQHVVDTVGTVVIDWSEGVVRVTGTGNPPDHGNLTQKRLMAERMATAEAYRHLAEAIYEIPVNSDTRIRDYISESEAIKSYISALIKGAQKMDQRYLDNGTIEVDMAVKLYSNSGLSGVIQPQKHVVPPPPVTLEPTEKPGEFTGVIVDCRGLGLAAAMSPAIISQTGGEVYLGNHEVKPDMVINEGIVGYAHSLDQARQNKRVGAKPLIIKGTSATGNLRTDVIITDVDTKQLMGLEKALGLLKDSKVILVL